MKLKFIKDAYYNGERKYIAGTSYDISDELGEATRWLKRGLAEEIGYVQEIIKEELIIIKEEIVIVKEEKVDEALLEEVIVKEELKKENGKVKRKKGIPLNENPEVL